MAQDNDERVRPDDGRSLQFGLDQRLRNLRFFSAIMIVLLAVFITLHERGTSPWLELLPGLMMCVLGLAFWQIDRRLDAIVGGTRIVPVSSIDMGLSRAVAAGYIFFVALGLGLMGASKYLPPSVAMRAAAASPAPVIPTPFPTPPRPAFGQPQDLLHMHPNLPPVAPFSRPLPPSSQRTAMPGTPGMPGTPMQLRTPAPMPANAPSLATPAVPAAPPRSAGSAGQPAPNVPARETPAPAKP